MPRRRLALLAVLISSLAGWPDRATRAQGPGAQPSGQAWPSPQASPQGPAPMGQAGSMGTSPTPGPYGADGTGASAGQPGAPGSGAPGTSPTAPTPGADTSPSAYSGLGGGLGGPAGELVMFGDQAPLFRLAQIPGFAAPQPPFPPVPPGPPRPPFPRSFLLRNAQKAEQVLPWVRGFKIADNMSPRPQDRVFFTFNYFNNINYAVNSRIGSPVSNIQIFRYMLGFEKTFLDGNASIGIRDNINTLTSNSPVRGLGGTNSSMGDLSVFSKLVLWQKWQNSGSPGTGPYPFQPAQANGGLISGGLAVTVPTGPGAFAGAPASKSFRDTQLQPFLGYFFSKGDLYLLGFESINVPLDPNDVTMLFTDVGVGYFFYRGKTPQSPISAASLTFEVHVNDPLNHRHPFNVNDLAGTADIVDFTYGANFFFNQRALFSTAIVTPVTGPRPFNFEVLALVNIYFGKSSPARQLTTPTVLGN